MTRTGRGAGVRLPPRPGASSAVALRWVTITKGFTSRPQNSAPGDSGIIGRNIERFSSRDSLGVQWARVT